MSQEVNNKHAVELYRVIHMLQEFEPVVTKIGDGYAKLCLSTDDLSFTIEIVEWSNSIVITAKSQIYHNCCLQKVINSTEFYKCEWCLNSIIAEIVEVFNKKDKQ